MLEQIRGRARRVLEALRKRAHDVRSAVRLSKPYRRWWNELTRQDRKAVRRYVIGMLWAAAFVAFTPSAISEALDTTVRVVVPAGAILGGALAVYGRVRFEHLTWELRGSFLMVAGLAFYAAVQVSLVLFVGLPSGDTDRVALSILAVWILLEVEDRLEYLLRAFWRRVRSGDTDDEVEAEK